jgi:hypothetical protein
MDKLEEINETVAVETAQETIIEQDPLIELDIEEQATFIQDDDEDDELKIYGENQEPGIETVRECGSSVPFYLTVYFLIILKIYITTIIIVF